MTILRGTRPTNRGSIPELSPLETPKWLQGPPSLQFRGHGLGWESSGLRRPEGEDDHSPPFRVQVKNAPTFDSTQTYFTLLTSSCKQG